MKRQRIVFWGLLILLLNAFQAHVSAQELTLDEGLIKVEYKYFQRKGGRHHKYSLPRTRILPSPIWFCTKQLDNDEMVYSDLSKLTDSYNFYYKYQSQSDAIELLVNIAQGTDNDTDGNNCKDGVTDKDGFYERKIDVNYSMLNLGNLIRDASPVYGVEEANEYYLIQYYFYLTPINNLKFYLQQPDQKGDFSETKGVLCADKPLTLGVDGNTEGHYKIKSISYEYNADNEKDEGIKNPISCREGPEQSVGECWYYKGKCPPDATECECCEVDYYWQEPQLAWKPLGTVGVDKGYEISDIDLYKLIANPGNSGKSIKFRSRIELYNGKFSEWKESDFYTVYPGVPDLDTKPVQIKPACYGAENGSITLKTLKEDVDLKTLNAKFFLASLDSNDTVAFAINPQFNNNSITIDNLKAGRYRLNYFIASDNLCEGNVEFTIEELDALEKYGPASLIQPQCFNDPGDALLSFVEVPGWQQPNFYVDGIIKTSDPTATTHEIIDGKNIVTYRINDFPADVANSLKTVANQQQSGQVCTADFNDIFTFDQPERVIANEPTITHSKCNTGYNAEVNIEGIKGGLTNTSYTIRLTDQQNAIIAEKVTKSASAILNLDKPGDFHVVIVDSSALNCPGFETDIQLKPLASLTFDTISVIDNPCTASQIGQISGKHPAMFDQAVVQLLDAGNAVKSVLKNNNSWSFDGLSSGNYTVKLSRSESCADFTTSPINISNPPKIDIHLHIDPISCMDSTDGQLKALITDHQRDYDFWWKNEGQIINNTDLTISNLSPGEYQLITLPRTTDGIACDTDADTTIAQIVAPTRVEAILSYDSLLCLDPAINKLRIGQLAGGSTLFNILINKNNKPYIDKKSYYYGNFELDTLTDGAFEVWVTDAARPECPGFHQAFEIEPVEPLALSTDIIMQNACYGDKKGKINISWKGQKAILNFSDELGISSFSQNLSGNNPLVIDSLGKGDYTILLSRSAGCNEKTIKTFSIIEPKPIRFDYLKEDIDCFGMPTGSISGLISGGKGNYNWQWWRNGENTGYAGQGLTTQYNKLIEGRYALKVLDDSLCNATFEIDIVPLAQELLVELEANDISCYGAEDGLVSASISGGALPYQLFWHNSSEEIPNKTTKLNIPKTDTIYLQVIDDKGCHAFDTASIYEPPKFSFPDFFRLCNDQPYKVTAAYDEQDASFLWKADNGFYATTPEVVLQKQGKYTVAAIRSNGCENIEEFRVETLNVEFMASFLGASWVEVGDTIYLKEISRPKPDSVFWDYSEGIVASIDTLGDPLISANAPGEYKVGMFAYKDSCMTYITQTFTFFAQGEAPQLLENDIFGPKGIESFVVKPNPNDGRFEIGITMYSAEPVALFLYDVHGKERWRTKDETAKTAYNFAFDGPVLESGTYLLMAISKSSRETLKVVVR